MLRRILEKLIVEYAGDYIQDFRREQLKFTALKGEVLLQDLELRTDALVDVTAHLPLTVVGCHVDQLKIKIPWKKLKREAVSVVATGVYLVISPQNLAETGAPGDTWSDVVRRQQLKAAELVRSQWEKVEAKDVDDVDLDEDLHLQGGKAKKIPFSKRVLGRVLDNIRVSLEDIVVQYEDCLYDPKNPHAFTFRIRKVDMFTTDAAWAKTFVDRRSRKGKTQPTLHRMLNLFDLSLSWSRHVTGRKTFTSHVPLHVSNPRLSLLQTTMTGPTMSRTQYVPPLEDSTSLDSESVTSEASNLTDLSATSPTKRSFRKRMSKTIKKLGKRKKKPLGNAVAVEQGRKHRHSLSLSLSPQKKRVPESSRLSSLDPPSASLMRDLSKAEEDQEPRPQEQWWSKLQGEPESSRRFILSPLSIQSKVIQGNPSQDRTRTRAKSNGRRISVESQVSRLRFSLDNVDYKDLAIFTERLTAHEAFVTQSAFQKLRPSLRPSMEPRAWWRYACKAITLTVNSGTRWTDSNAAKLIAANWSNTVQLLDRRTDYVLLWKQQIVFSSPKLLRLAQKVSLATVQNTVTSSSSAAPSPRVPSPTNASSFASVDEIGLGPDGVQQALLALEAKLSLSQIMLFRCLAEKELELETKRLKEHKSSIVELRRSLSLKRSKAKKKKRDTWMLSAVEKQLLYEDVTDRFASLSVIPDPSGSAMISQLRLELDMKLSLSDGASLSLFQKDTLTGASKELIRLVVGVIECTAVWQQEESIEVFVSVDSVTCTDKYFGKASLMQTLLSHRTRTRQLQERNSSAASTQPYAPTRSDAKKLVKLSFSWRNGHKVRDVYSVSATAAPIRVVLSPRLVKLLVDTFTVDELAYMAPKTLDRLRSFRQTAQERLQRRLFSSTTEEGPFIDVTVDWGAPELVIPADVSSPTAVTAVVQLGRLAVHSTSCSSISATNPSYDLVTCAFSGLSVMLTTVTPQGPPQCLVEPFGAVVNVWRKIKAQPSPGSHTEYSIDTPLSALICVDGTIDPISCVLGLPDLLNILRLVEAFTMSTDQLFTPKPIQRSRSLGDITLVVDSSVSKSITRARARTVTESNVESKRHKGSRKESTVSKAQGRRKSSVRFEEMVSLERTTQLEVEVKVTAPKISVDLKLEPAAEVHTRKFEGWEWTWDQETTDDTFPQGMLTASVEGTGVRFATNGDASTVLVQTKALAVEDRLQRASPAFFYFVGTIPSDQQYLLKMSAIRTRQQGLVNASVGKLCIQWNHTTVSSLCRLAAVLDARVQAASARLQRLKQLQRDTQMVDSRRALKRSEQDLPWRVRLTAEAAYVLLNQETEGRHLACVRAAGLSVVVTAVDSESEVEVSLDDACITDVSYTKPSISRMRMAPNLKGPLFISKKAPAAGSTGHIKPFLHLSMANCAEQGIDSIVRFTVHDFRFLWAHTFTKAVSDYVVDAMIEPVSKAFTHADPSVTNPTTTTTTKRRVAKSPVSVVVEGDILNATVIIPALRAGRDYQYKEGKANDEAVLEADRVGIGVTVFTNQGPPTTSTAVVSTVDPLPFPTADIAIAYGKTKSKRDPVEELPKQAPATEIRMEFTGVEVFVTKADRPEPTISVSNVFGGKLFWHIVDFTPAQQAALVHSDCDYCATDMLLRQRLQAKGGGPGSLFKAPAQRFSICVDVDEVKLDLSSLDVVLFGFAFTENIRDWRRNLPVTPEPTFPLFRRGATDPSQAGYTSTLPVRFNGTELVAETAQVTSGLDAVYANAPALDAASLAFDYERFYLGASQPVVFLEVDVRVSRGEVLVHGGDGKHSNEASQPLLQIKLDRFEFVLGECQRRQQVMDIQTSTVDVYGFDANQRAHHILALKQSPAGGSTRCRVDKEVLRRAGGQPLRHEWGYEQRSAGFAVVLLKYSTGKEKRVEITVGQLDVTPDAAVLSRMPPLMIDTEEVRRELGLPNFTGTGGGGGARLMRSGIVVAVDVAQVEMAVVQDWERPEACNAVLVYASAKVMFVQNRTGCIKVEANIGVRCALKTFKEFVVVEDSDTVSLVKEDMDGVEHVVASRPVSTSKEDLRAWLRAVYIQYKPEKVAEVEQILNMFGQAHAEQLIQMVCAKYDLSNHPSPRAKSPSAKGKGQKLKLSMPSLQQRTLQGAPSRSIPSKTERCFSESTIVEEVKVGIHHSLEKAARGNSSVDTVDTMVEAGKIEVKLGLAECEDVLGLYNVLMTRWGSSEGMVEPSGVGSMVAQSNDFFVLVSNGLTVTVSNDYGLHPVPFVRLQLANLTLKGQGRAEEERRVESVEVKLFQATGGRQETAEDCLSVSYYNHQIMQWEPLLEPWSFTGSLKRVHTTEAEQMSLNVVSFTMLDLNLSYAFAESLSLLNASRLLRQSGGLHSRTERPTDTSSLQASYEYYVRNNTGMALQVSSVTNDLADVADGAMQQLRLAHQALRTISFTVEEAPTGMVWELQGTVSLSRYGTFVHSLFPVNAAVGVHPLKVVCKLTLDYLGKVIVSIASPVCLLNRTHRQLSLLLLPRSHANPTLLEPFLPGSTLYIPLNKLDASIKFRPLAETEGKGKEEERRNGDGDVMSGPMMEAEAAGAAVELAELSGYGWGELVDLCELHKKVDKRFVVASRRLKALKYAGSGDVMLENGDKSRDTNKAAGMLNEFTCYYRVLAFNSDNRPRIKETYDIELEPPIKLQNRLPVPLYYRVLSVQQRHKKSLGNVPINGGEVPIREETEVFHHPYTLPTETATSSASKELEDQEGISSGELLLGICVPGTTWSESWQPSEVFGSAYNGRVVNAPGNELVVRSYNHSVLVVYADGNPLQINLESSRSAAGSIQVCAYVSAWLINRTRLQLKFRASGENLLDEIGYRFRDLTARRESLEDGPDGEEDNEVVMFSEASSLSVNMRSAAHALSTTSHGSPQENDKWSPPINLAAVGTRSDIYCEVAKAAPPPNASTTQPATTTTTASSKQKHYHVAAMAVSLAPPPFARSKVVTFVPRFILVNCLPDARIVLRQRVTREPPRKRGAILSSRERESTASGARGWLTLGPGEGRNLEIVDARAVGKGGSIDPMMLVSLPVAEGWDWSGGFRISSVDEQAVKVHNVCTGETKVLRIRTEAEGATTVCKVSAESEAMPLYRIENESSELVHYYQLVSDRRRALLQQLSHGLGLSSDTADAEALQDVREYKGVVERLFPGESKVFGWDEPCVEGRAIVLAFEGDRVMQVVLIDVLETHSTPLKVELSNRTLLVSTRVDGITKCLVVYDEASSSTLRPSIHDDKSFQNVPDSPTRILSPLGFLQHQLARRLRKHRGGFQLHERQRQAAITAPPLCFQLRLCGASLSVIDRAPQEIALVTLKGVNLNYYRVVGDEVTADGDAHETLEVSVHLFQVDNQLEGATFPVMVAPTSKWNSLKEPVAMMELADFHPSQPQRVDAGTQPACIQVSIVKRMGFSNDFDFLDFFSVMVQELDVKVEDTTLLLLYRLFWEVSNRFAHEQEAIKRTWDAGATFTSSETGPDSSLADHLAAWLAAHKKRSVLYRLEASNADVEAEEDRRSDLPSFGQFLSGEARKLYVQLLHLHPLSINLSFAFSAKDREVLLTHRNLESAIWTDQVMLQRLERFNPSIFMSLLPPSLVDVEDAQIRLDAFVVPHLFAFRQQWIEAVGRHYFQQLVTQVYKVIGSIDMLGNPVGVFNYIGSGLSDFIMEPAKGMRESSVSTGLANGVARGTASLVRNTLLGSFDAISKLSGALGTGVAYLSFDDRFVADRRTDFRDRRPRHIGTGLMLGAEALATNLYDGFGGIVFQPLQSIEDGRGFEGFVKGLGRGIVGIAVRPVVGVLDATARTASGIKSSAEALDSTLRKPLGRVRLPRMLYISSRELRRFNEQDAFINELVVQVWKASTRPQTREYLMHIAMDSTLVIVATTAYLSCIDYGQYTSNQLVNLISSRELLLWSLPLHKISDVSFSLVSGKVRLSLNNAASVNINQSAIRSLSLSINTDISAAGAFLLQVSKAGGGLQPMSPTEGQLQGKAEFMIPVDSSARGEALSVKLRSVLKRRQAPLARKRLGIVLSNGEVKQGILVESVMKGSLAETAGIESGDVLAGMRIGSQTTRFQSRRGAIVSLKKLMEDHSSGKTKQEVALVCIPKNQQDVEAIHTLRFPKTHP